VNSEKIDLQDKQEVLLRTLVLWRDALQQRGKLSQRESFAGILWILMLKLWFDGAIKCISRPQIHNTFSDIAKEFLEEAGWDEPYFYDWMLKLVSGSHVDDAWAAINGGFELASFEVETIDEIIRKLEKNSNFPSEHNYALPSYLKDSLLELMEVKPNMAICDLACGTGDMLIAISDNLNGGGGLRGYERDSVNALVASIRLMLRGYGPDVVKWSDPITDRHIENESFDFIFLNSPLGKRSKVYEIDLRGLEIEESFDEASWLETSYTLKALAMLKNGGRMVAVLPTRILTSPEFLHFRNLVLKTSHIDAVVEFRWHYGFGGMRLREAIVMERLERGIMADNRTYIYSIYSALSDEVVIKSSWKNFLSAYSQWRVRRSSEGENIVRLQDVCTWSPKALLADISLKQQIKSIRLLRLGSLMSPRERPRFSDSVSRLYYINHAKSGIVRSNQKVEFSPALPFVPMITVAETGDLLFSKENSSILVDSVPQSCDGQALRGNSRVYSPKPHEEVYSPEILAIIFKSPKYLSYVRKRMISDSWHEDILNFLIPLPDKLSQMGLISSYKTKRSYTGSLYSRLYDLSQKVTAYYKATLGIKQRGGIRYNYWSEQFRTLRLSDLVEVRADGSGRDCTILRNLRITSNEVTEKYLSGFMICSFLPRKVLDVSCGLTDYGYMKKIVESVGVIVPSLGVQREMEILMCEYITEFLDTLLRLSETKDDNELGKGVDRLLFV